MTKVGLPRLSMLMGLMFTALALIACEDEPEQTRERLDDAIGQREVQDLVQDEDEEDAGSSQQDEEEDGDDEDDEGERR